MTSVNACVDTEVELSNRDKYIIIGYLKDLAEKDKSPLFKYQVECVIESIEEDLK